MLNGAKLELASVPTIVKGAVDEGAARNLDRSAL